MNYKLGDSNKWSADVKIYNHSYMFRYPCQDSFSECTYYVTLKSGSDIFETWGAEGGWNVAKVVTQEELFRLIETKESSCLLDQKEKQKVVVEEDFQLTKMMPHVQHPGTS